MARKLCVTANLSDASCGGFGPLHVLPLAWSRNVCWLSTTSSWCTKCRGAKQLPLCVSICKVLPRVCLRLQQGDAGGCIRAMIPASSEEADWCAGWGVVRGHAVGTHPMPRHNPRPLCRVPRPWHTYPMHTHHTTSPPTTTQICQESSDPPRPSLRHSPTTSPQTKELRKRLGHRTKKIEQICTNPLFFSLSCSFCSFLQLFELSFSLLFFSSSLLLFLSGLFA